MRYAVASSVVFAAAVVASPVAQGVTEQIKPDSSAPSGCSSSYDGDFEISVTNVTSSALRKRQQEGAEKLEITLKDGVLTDSKDRTGYIAANHQFQFDGPAQTGAIYTAGWSACSNGSLALGGSTVFYQCLSGDFYNLYDESTGEQCNEVHINIGGPAASQAPDGQPQETPAASVAAISDGQPQAATSAASVAQISDGQPQAATSAASVAQITDGQIQAATSAVVAPTGAPVSQIPDGQIQASTAAAPAVSQIPDGQIQAPYSNGTATVAAVAPSGTGAIDSPAPFEGAASKAYTAGAAAIAALFGLVVAL